MPSRQKEKVLFTFFFYDTATTEIYTLSLHDALPISKKRKVCMQACWGLLQSPSAGPCTDRSEEHTSELRSRRELVCRLLLEKKKSKATSFPSVNCTTRTNLIIK